MLCAEVFGDAKSRGACDCAICMFPIVHVSAAQPNQNTARRNVILSCTHVFHEHCIGNFEKFLANTVRLRNSLSL